MAKWPNPDLRRKLERRLAARARDVLEDRIPLIVATQEMLKLALQLGLGEGDSVYDDLRLISSETDGYPLKQERELWDPQALAQLQPNIDRAEAWAREFGLQTCRTIVARFPTNAAAT